MSEPRFIHLKVHSDFSIVDGLSKVSSLVKRVAELRMPAVALTDITNFFGLVKFYAAAHESGIKPIIGAEFYVQSPEFGDELTRLTLLAADNEGYKNITLLISRAYLRGHIQHQPVIDKEWLVEHRVGVIVLSGARKGDVGRAVLKRKKELVEQCINFYHTYFPDRYYIELIRTGRDDEAFYLHCAIDLAFEYDLPVVATNDVMFTCKEMFDAHEIRVAINGGYTLTDPSRPSSYSPEQYLRPESEMCELFKDIPEALTNSVEIAKKCNVTLCLGKYFLPQFPTQEGMDFDAFLIKMSEEGLEKRLESLFPDQLVRSKKRPEYEERLRNELEVINQMGFPGYFLIVMEFIQWSKENGVPVGPGRGSGAGSLVAYSLRITDLDPLEYDLLFERFLNPERVSMPDFDIDFCMEKRDLVIDHVADIYGREAVSQIITFGTMAARAVIRDVGRVLGHPFSFVEKISKIVPLELGMTLEKALLAEPALANLYANNEEVHELIDICRILEGCTRNASKHAGGVVISPTAITDFSPIYCDAEGKFPVTQFDKTDIETAGLVKFDFLGLRTLTVIDRALSLVNSRRQKEGLNTISIGSINLSDPDAFKLLKSSETTAVFQLESRGMKDLIRRLRPDCFEDMIALVALFRPGPLQSGMVDNFIDRKHGREPVSYPDEEWQHDSLKEILEPTYGIILYQEQVMQIAQVLAGYALGDADILRRAMSKKKSDEMAKQRMVFEKGAITNNVDGQLAMKIFDLVEKFAGYGFNKSHSAAYALVSYQTLWLKAHFPAEFMAAAMTADMGNNEKLTILVEECRRMGLKLLRPDINTGLHGFNVDNFGRVQYGMDAIRGVGEISIDAILQERTRGGDFKNIFDFCSRIDSKVVSRRVIERLICSGALDSLGAHRAALMVCLGDALKFSAQRKKAEMSGQADIFGTLEVSGRSKQQWWGPEWSEKIRLEREREALGLYLTGHPIESYLEELRHYTSCKLKDLVPKKCGELMTIAGLVIDHKIITTKHGDRMGTLLLDDGSGKVETVLFPDIIESYAGYLKKDNILIVKGNLRSDVSGNRLKIVVQEITGLDSAREKNVTSLSLSVHQESVDDAFLSRLYQILEPHKSGSIPVNVHYRCHNAEACLVFGSEWWVTISDKLLWELRELIGKDCLELRFK